MKSTIGILSLLSIISITSTVKSETYRLSGAIEKSFSQSGEDVYNFHLSAVEEPFPGGSAELALRGPDGTKYVTDYSYNIVSADLDDIPANDVDRLVAGQWTLVETLATGTINEYGIDIEPISSTPFAPVPVFTSPENESIVSPVFDVEWSPFVMGSCGFSTRGSSDIFARAEIDCHGDGTATFSYEHVPDFGGEEIYSLHATRGFRIEDLYATPLNPEANAVFTGNQLFAESISPPLRLTVVPEPSSLAHLLWIFFTTVTLRKKLSS